MTCFGAERGGGGEGKGLGGKSYSISPIRLQRVMKKSFVLAFFQGLY